MLIHEASKSVLLRVRDPFMIRDILPKSKTIVLPDVDFNVAVKHTLESTKVLRNIGIHIPAPILSQYRWPGKYKPMSQQYEMASFMSLYPRCFNLGEPGTGKTAATLWAADWLMDMGFVEKVLVIAPLSTLDLVWGPDIFNVLMHRKVVTVHGSVEKRLKMLAADVDFYLLNHDGVSIEEIRKVIRLRPEINLVIVDEGSVFRNAGTGRYENLAKMLRPTQKLWWLTGTPTPNAPTDAWSQVKLVSPQNVPAHFGAFRRLTMTKGYGMHDWDAKPEAASVVHRAMQPAIRIKKKDCMELPPVTFLDRSCQMTSEQRAAFKEMTNSMVAEAATGVRITAVNAADKIGKLRQILLGCIKIPNGGEFGARVWAASTLKSHRYQVNGAYVTLPHAPRLEVLLECMEQALGKTIIIVPFKGITQVLEQELRKKGRSVAVLNGDVSVNERTRIVQAFKSGPDPHDLLCHPKVMSHGLNLVEADTTIFYGPIYSNDEFQQVIERFNRAGQTRKMTVWRIGAHPLDWSIYKRVDNKRDAQDSILNLYKTIMEMI